MIKLIFLFISLIFNLPQDDTLVTRIYPIQDLEMTIPDFRSAPEMDLQSALNNENTLLRDSASDSFSSRKDYQAIIDIIQQNIEPEIWYDTASVKYWKGNLIIRAPQRIHDQLQ